MTLREQITAAALLGSAQPIPLEPAGSALEAFLPALSKRESTQGLLDAIALIATYEEAGAAPLRATAAISPSEPDPRPLCGPAAAGHLALLIADRRALLSEWFDLLAKAGLRPPEELAPALLDLATTDRALRKSVLAATGPLGVWLSRFRPEWGWVHAPGLDPAIWETGSLDERKALLQQLRSTEPELAHKLIESSWQTESADTRRQFLEALSGAWPLSAEDFLEAALDDRSAVVRRVASSELASIAGSKASQRMFERLAGRVQLGKAGLLGRTKTIEVTPFENLAPGMIRDGIAKKPEPGSPLGERAWWTAQAIGCVDPAIWTRELRLDPSQLFEAADKGQWSELLLEGWLAAAVRYRNADWLRALAGRIAPLGHNAPEVFAAMAVEAREASMMACLGRDAKAWITRLAVCCRHAWTPEFTGAVLSVIVRNKPKDAADGFCFDLKMALREIAYLASPQMADISDDEIFAEFTETLTFRRALRQALARER